MRDDCKLRLAFTSTGIQVEAVDGSGQVLAAREIGFAKIFHWVSFHADRSSAVGLDTAIGVALERDEATRGSSPAAFLCQSAMIQRIANGIEEIAS